MLGDFPALSNTDGQYVGARSAPHTFFRGTDFSRSGCPSRLGRRALSSQRPAKLCDTFFYRQCSCVGPPRVSRVRKSIVLGRSLTSGLLKSGRMHHDERDPHNHTLMRLLVADKLPRRPWTTLIRLAPIAYCLPTTVSFAMTSQGHEEKRSCRIAGRYFRQFDISTRIVSVSP